MHIYDGRPSFYQWDIDRKITDNRLTVGEEIHFVNTRQTTALVVKAYDLDGKVVADVPNILLQDARPITAYRYIKQSDGSYTTAEYIFGVTQRPKPDDYFYTETEIFTIQKEIESALQEAKDSGEFDGEDGKDGRDGYTPVKGKDYYTEAEKDEIVSEAVTEVLAEVEELTGITAEIKTTVGVV